MVRGGPRHGRGRGGHMKPRPPFIPHVPFDIVLAEPAFPQVAPPKEEQEKAYQDVSFHKFSVRIQEKAHILQKVLILLFLCLPFEFKIKQFKTNFMTVVPEQKRI